VTTFQKLVLKALSQILLIISNPRQSSLKDLNDADDLRNEIKNELKKEI
jgi:hypothetical protein